MRKILLMVLTFVLSMYILAPPTDAVALPHLSAEGAVLIDEVSGRVLYAKNANRRLFPASTTKILTALVLLENASPDEEITIGQEILYIGRKSSHAGLRVGEVLSVADLLMAIMLPSGNDAAYSAAVYVARKASGDEQMPLELALEFFAEKMTDRARQLGAINSNFVNPDGFHHPDHYTTAMDLALISREALRHQSLREVVGTRRHARDRFVGDEDPVTRVWLNTNRLILASKDQFPEATGLKTGYTSQAGFCLAASASREGVRVIGVMLNSTNSERWLDAHKLLDYGLGNFVYQNLVEENQVLGSLPVKGQGAGEPAELKAVSGLEYGTLFTPKELENLSLEVVWDTNLLGDKDYISAPITAGTHLGLALWKLDGKVVFETPLLSIQDIQAKAIWRLGVVPLLPGGVSLAGLVFAGMVRARKRGKKLFSRRRKRHLV